MPLTWANADSPRSGRVTTGRPPAGMCGGDRCRRAGPVNSRVAGPVERDTPGRVPTRFSLLGQAQAADLHERCGSSSRMPRNCGSPVRRRGAPVHGRPRVVVAVHALNEPWAVGRDPVLDGYLAPAPWNADSRVPVAVFAWHVSLSGWFVGHHDRAEDRIRPPGRVRWPHQLRGDRTRASRVGASAGSGTADGARGTISRLRTRHVASRTPCAAGSSGRRRRTRRRPSGAGRARRWTFAGR
jgi:hypothetical protein